MSRFTRQDLFKALQALPQPVKDVVLSVDSADAFHKIMEEQGLTVEQIGIVANEVAPVTVGLMRPEDLPLQLKRQLPSFSQEKLDKLIGAIDAVLLKEIRDKIVALAHDTTERSSTTTPPTPVEKPSSAPVPSVPAQTTVVADTKLAGSVHFPPETLKVVQPATTITTPTTIPTPPPVVSGTTYRKDSDPYREPIA